MKSKILLLPILGFVLISGTSKTKTDPLLMGIYRITGFNNGQSLTIKPDHQFIFQRYWWDDQEGRGGEMNRVRGSYRVNGDKLILKPEYFIHAKYGANDEEALPIDSMVYQPGSSIYLKTTYQILAWDSARYLLSEDYTMNEGSKTEENDYDVFSWHYNSGYEPGRSGWYFTKRREGYIPGTPLDISRLPAKYRKRFLLKPIVARVLNVEITEAHDENGKNASTQRYKLNKGSKDGITRDLKFFGYGGNHPIKITEVRDHVCYGEISIPDDTFGYRENDLLSTSAENDIASECTTPKSK